MFSTRKVENQKRPFERVRIVLRFVNLVLPNPQKVALFPEPRVGIKHRGLWCMRPRFDPCLAHDANSPFLLRGQLFTFLVLNLTCSVSCPNPPTAASPSPPALSIICVAR